MIQSFITNTHNTHSHTHTILSERLHKKMTATVTTTAAAAAGRSPIFTLPNSWNPGMRYLAQNPKQGLLYTFINPRCSVIYCKTTKQ